MAAGAAVLAVADREALVAVPMVALVLMGAGAGLYYPTLIQLGMANVPGDLAPSASSLQATVRVLAQLIGVVLFETIFSQIFPTALHVDLAAAAEGATLVSMQSAFHAVFACATVIALAALVPAMMLGRPPGSPELADTLEEAGERGMSDHHNERAVAPNLFDVVVDPDLVFVLVLANLMSHRLWDLRERLMTPPAEAQDHEETAVERLQQSLDRHFEHVPPTRVAEMNGVVDLDVLALRYGADTVDYARSEILSTFKWRVQRGTLEKDAIALDLIEQRKFPAYTYATIDEARASRRLLQRRKHKPYGLTCCLDEAAIFAALILPLASASPIDIAFIGSPAHYSVVAWTTEGAWWLHSKHELHSPASWSSLVAETYAGDAQMAFDDRLPGFDRIVTSAGSHVFATGETSIPEPQLDELVGRLDAFFGLRTAQLDRALRQQKKLVPAPGVAPLVEGTSTAADAGEVRQRLRRAAFDDRQEPALRALYAFRTLDVPDPSIYLQAARHSIRIGDLLPRTATVEEAMAYVAAIPGNESIFDDPDRIAMPDETVRFATGTDRDKALLLHVLLEHSAGLDERARAGLETVLTDEGSYVRSGSSASTLGGWQRWQGSRVRCCTGWREPPSPAS